MVRVEDAYVGMRVMANDDMINDGLHTGFGALGFVCDVGSYEGQLGVAWDEPHTVCHDCEGNCDNRHGWYVNLEYLDPAVQLPDLEPGDGDISLLL